MAFLEWLKTMFTEMFSGMDWKQFIPSLIATFAGIFVPFWLQSRLEKQQKRHDAVRIIGQLSDELRKVKTQMQDREKRAQEKNEIFVDALQTPIGNSLIESNEKQLLLDLQKYLINKSKQKRNREKYAFANEEWYTKIFEIYADITTYNTLWGECAKQTIFIRNNFIVEDYDKVKISNASLHAREALMYQQAVTVLDKIFESKDSVAKKILGSIQDVNDAQSVDEGEIDSLLEILKQVKESIASSKNGGNK